MKRARSVLTLRYLADSLHSSIQQQNRTTAPSQSRPPLQTISTASLNHEQRSNRIFILEKQIACLEREVSSSKSTIRNYSRQLSQYEQITSNINLLELTIKTQDDHKSQLQNHLRMLEEEKLSILFNDNERIAEKEYYEEIVDTHQMQYQQQNQIVRNIIEKEEDNQKIKLQIEDIQRKLEKGKKDLEEWKTDISYDLAQHKQKNSIKLIRMELIGLEDKCDHFCQAHNLRSLRQLYCLFFKQHAKRNGLDHQQAEQGIDLFLCRQGLVDQFSEFIRQRLVFNKPHCQYIETYLSDLSKMEQIIIKSSNELTKRLHAVQVEELSSLEKGRSDLLNQMVKNKEAIRDVEGVLEQQFGQDSLAVIEYLREKSNKYDIQEIKTTLRLQKKEQATRIRKIKQAFTEIAHLEKVIERNDSQAKIMNLHEHCFEIEEELNALQEQIQEKQQELEDLSHQKMELQALINGAISKWRERDENKAKLKQLYQELSATQKSSKQGDHHDWPKQLALDRSVSFKNIPVKRSVPSEYPLAQSRTSSKHSKNNSIASLNQNKSVLSLNNPYERIMKRQIEHYEPIISDCQMILSKKLSSKQTQSKELTAKGDFAVSDLKQSRTNSVCNFKNTKPMRPQDKENNLWAVRTKPQLLSPIKLGVSMKPNLQPSAQTRNGKLSNSQRSSLSKLLITRFTR